MQSQLERDQRKFIKFEMSEWSRVFQIAMKGKKAGWKFSLNEFWPFSAFVMLKIRFSNHRLIKISMIYLYIKPEIKKNDTTATIAAINETCIVSLHEKCYLMREIFWCENWVLFLLLVGILLPSIEFAPNVWRIGQSSPNMVGTTGRMKREGTFLVRWGM